MIFCIDRRYLRMVCLILGYDIRIYKVFNIVVNVVWCC